MKKGFILLSAFLFMIISSCRKTHFKCDQDVSYQNDIKPFLENRCNKCHSYDTYAEAQSLANSGQFRKVTITTSKMPPASEKRLTLKERQKIYCWLEAGAQNN
jgi:uncharacterized membrane protein